MMMLLDVSGIFVNANSSFSPRGIFVPVDLYGEPFSGVFWFTGNWRRQEVGRAVDKWHRQCHVEQCESRLRYSLTAMPSISGIMACHGGFSCRIRSPGRDDLMTHWIFSRSLSTLTGVYAENNRVLIKIQRRAWRTRSTHSFHATEYNYLCSDNTWLQKNVLKRMILKGIKFS